MFLIGNSIDIHSLKKNGCLIKLGGLFFHSKWKINAHSDGDIILHALSESIYGALGLGDLGDHFPDKIPANYNIDSINILKDSLEKMRARKYNIKNVDMTIISEHIIFKDIKNNIRDNLIYLTGSNKINLKATRWESNQKIIQVNCSILLYKGSDYGS